MSTALAPRPAQLPPADVLRTWFSASTWTKGQAYARQGAVQELEVTSFDADECLLQGEVQGTEYEPYFVDVAITGWPSRLKVMTDCTCPVGGHCKHAAALIMVALQTKGPVPTKAPADPLAMQQMALDRWLEDTEKSVRPVAALKLHSSVSPAHRHVIVLSSVASPPGPGQWLSLWPGQAKFLKNKPGALGKVTMTRMPYAGSALSPYDGQGESFEHLRHWHAGQANSHRTFYNATPQPGDKLPSHAVKDEVGMALLERLARSGDLVVLNDERLIDRPIGWGPPQPLSWTWEDKGLDTTGSAQWSPAPRLSSPTAQLHLGSPMLYLDREAGLCGRVDAPGMTFGDAVRWLGMPPLPETWMRKHAPRLSRLLPHLPEAVRKDAPREIRGVEPTAHLSIAPHPDPANHLLQLFLSFDYDGARGRWGATSDLVQPVDLPEGVVHVWRNDLAEERLRERLRMQGYAEESAALGAWAAWDDTWGGISASQRDLDLLDSDFAAFREMGWHVEIDPGLHGRFRHAGAPTMSLENSDAGQQDGGWFDLSLGFTVDGQRVNLLPWLPALIERMGHWRTQAEQGREWPEHTWLASEGNGELWRVPVAPLRPWLDTLIELSQERRPGADGDALRIDRFEALRLAALDDKQSGAMALSLSAQDRKSLSGLVAMLRQTDTLSEVPMPSGLDAELRPYQRQGLGWLQLLRTHRLGGILADDMGLGKTLQTIAHLLTEKQAGRLKRPALVVAPTSLVGNWQSELHRFAPDLATLVLHGGQRHGDFKRIPEHDVVITTYPLLLRDEQVLVDQPWSIVVLDEAQTIKNARTRAAAIVQDLRSDQRLCLTGTPMENHLGEVWSLFHFLMPGYLGSEMRFKQLFRTPIEKHGDADRLALLRTRLSPFMLRRRKADVATELPPKIESVEHIELPPAQANLYETIRVATEAKVREALTKKGLARSHITVLDALLKLRQVCCDPRLVPLPSARKVKASAKIDWLVDKLPTMIEEGRRILLFSQFTSMLSLIEEALAAQGLRWTKLTGQSRNRDAIVKRFTSGEVPIMLISIKAGGVGLNLPQADTVIHVDPWWNPAVEDQATDRAHRMGQTNTVFVYKLVAKDTLEERIVAMQERKAALAKGLHGAAQGDAVRLTESELDWLLRPIGHTLPSSRRA
jgi:superfamily II DNA or RNA helicase